MLTAVYLRNRLPTRALNGVTPYEAWRGDKPDLSHLKVWGCLAYVHVHRVKRNKLAKRARACVFVGYAPEAKGWKLYDPHSARYIIARDATFQESVSGTKALVGGGDHHHRHRHRHRRLFLLLLPPSVHHRLLYLSCLPLFLRV